MVVVGVVLDDDSLCHAECVLPDKEESVLPVLPRVLPGPNLHVARRVQFRFGPANSIVHAPYLFMPYTPAHRLPSRPAACNRLLGGIVVLLYPCRKSFSHLRAMKKATVETTNERIKVATVPR